MKILVMPDIHGRGFWKSVSDMSPTASVSDTPYDKVVFLGDYLDPYPFEGIGVDEAISNFREILAFANANREKVTLLLGNHDMPYFSREYRNLSRYHSRIAPYEEWEGIEALFRTGEFSLSCVIDGILFTHAGVDYGWLTDTFPGYRFDGDVGGLSEMLNTLLGEKGYRKLYVVSYTRYGDYPYGSCIWSDVDDLTYERSVDGKAGSFLDVRQVFGHTLQVKEIKTAPSGKDVVYGEPVEAGNIKMLDTARAYVLDTDSFTVTEA